MNISLIVAHGKNREIGKDNKLLWHIPADLKNFKKYTLNHVLVMGRKTFESIGKALPKRKTIILTKQHDYHAPDGCLVATSVDQAIALAQNETQFNKDELFVVGGGEIYELFLPSANKLYISIIDNNFEADTYFPEITYQNWQLLEECSFGPIADQYAWSFAIWNKK